MPRLDHLATGIQLHQQSILWNHVGTGVLRVSKPMDHDGKGFHMEYLCKKSLGLSVFQQSHRLITFELKVSSIIWTRRQSLTNILQAHGCCMSVSKSDSWLGRFTTTTPTRKLPSGVGWTLSTAPARILKSAIFHYQWYLSHSKIYLANGRTLLSVLAFLPWSSISKAFCHLFHKPRQNPHFWTELSHLQMTTHPWLPMMRFQEDVHGIKINLSILWWCCWQCHISGHARTELPLARTFHCWGRSWSKTSWSRPSCHPRSAPKNWSPSSSCHRSPPRPVAEASLRHYRR